MQPTDTENFRIFPLRIRTGNKYFRVSPFAMQSNSSQEEIMVSDKRASSNQIDIVKGAPEILREG